MNGFTKKIEVEIKRPNGQIEVLDVTSKMPYNQELFSKAKIETKKAGRGEMLRVTRTYSIFDKSEFIAYNNLHNEGGEGYVPENLRIGKEIVKTESFEVR